MLDYLVLQTASCLALGEIRLRYVEIDTRTRNQQLESEYLIFYSSCNSNCTNKFTGSIGKNKDLFCPNQLLKDN